MFLSLTPVDRDHKVSVNFRYVTHYIPGETDSTCVVHFEDNRRPPLEVSESATKIGELLESYGYFAANEASLSFDEIESEFDLIGGIFFGDHGLHVLKHTGSQKLKLEITSPKGSKTVSNHNEVSSNQLNKMIETYAKDMIRSLVESAAYKPKPKASSSKVIKFPFEGSDEQL